MSKQKIGRVISRTYKRDYGKRKKPLPEDLIFLYDIPFYAVTECQSPDSIKRQIRVEILPNSLKKLSESNLFEKAKNDKLYEKICQLEQENDQIKKAFKLAMESVTELEEHTELLEFNNKQLMKNIEDNYVDDTVPFKSVFRSHLQKMIDQNIELQRFIGIQAGNPGLGKKK